MYTCISNLTASVVMCVISRGLFQVDPEILHALLRATTQLFPTRGLVTVFVFVHQLSEVPVDPVGPEKPGPQLSGEKKKKVPWSGQAV